MLVLQKSYSRRSHLTCSVKKIVLKFFANFTGKYLCWRVFFNDTILKNISEQVLLLWLFCIPVTQKEKQALSLWSDYTSRLFLTALLQVAQGMLLMYLRNFLEFFRELQSYAKKNGRIFSFLRELEKTELGSTFLWFLGITISVK